MNCNIIVITIKISYVHIIHSRKVLFGTTLMLTHLKRAYHVSEVCTEGASGLVILHHTVIVEDFSTAFTTEAKERCAL